ncbi:sodium:solute symporter family protein [Pseudomonas cerasi]|uniref:Sodium/solute symporter n=1 Tax=Pseudomonas cerasi TaxID=1583341 RepID=A0A193SMF2_9PSED|nr:sodium:solute symporter family protein [Pseudomonas cerasi]CZT28244.1 sodium/solute symporter [Pseudomonas cerasi]SOS18334.1 sodium/solute symporter [Pseudomonas cerasi]
MDTFNAQDTSIIIGMVVVYILITTWMSMRLRSKTSEQYMVASRTMPAFVVGVLMMSEFIGAKSTVGTAQAAFESGFAASWSVTAAAIGFPLFGLLMARKLYSSGEFTISGFIAKKYGTSTKLAVSIIMIYALLLVNVGNYVSGAAAIATVLKINLTTAAFITAIISTLYYVFGGLKSVAYMSILHTGVKYIGVLIVLGVALKMTGGFSPVVQNMPEHYFTWDGAIGGSKILAWIIGTVGAIFSTQFIIQAISSTQNQNAARRSTFYASLLCIPIALALGFIGVASKYLHPEMSSLYALPIFLQSMSPVLAGVVTISLVASIFVSVSTVALAIASLVVRDFYVPWRKPSVDQEFKTTRLIALVIGFVPLFFVFFVPEILNLSFFTRALRLSIAVVAMIAIYLPFFGSGRGATLGLIASAITTSVWYLLNNPYGIDNMYIALVTPAIVIAIERLLPQSAPSQPANPVETEVPHANR